MAKFYMVMGNSDNIVNYAWRISEAFKIVVISYPDEDSYPRIAHLLHIGEDVVIVNKYLSSQDRRATMKALINITKVPFQAAAVVCNFNKDDKSFERPSKAEGFDEIWYYDGTNWEEK